MKIHIVQKGDTLWEIAKKYGVDFEEVKELNPQLSSPDMIMPGMKIKIASSTKPINADFKESEQSKKEEQLKDTSKPIGTITEDDIKNPKEVKVEVPIPHIPQPMQLPVMNQEMDNYTAINLSESPAYSEPIPQYKGKALKEMPKEGKKDEMMHPHPICCHSLHPRGHQAHYFFPPEAQMHLQQMKHDYPVDRQMVRKDTLNTRMEIPMRPIYNCDCQQIRQPMNNRQQNYSQLDFRHLESNYPPRFFGCSDGISPHPTPPVYPSF